MKILITLPPSVQPTTIRMLLEENWLIPRKTRHFLRIRKNVYLNGKAAQFQEIAAAGDQITLVFDPEDYNEPKILSGKAELFTPLFEDEHVLIANKPIGMKTHPNQPDEQDTLLNHAEAYLKGSGAHPFVVHRLDKETSGAVLFAKNQFILPILGRLLEQHAIKRTYQAKVSGILPQDQFVINEKIGRHRHDRRKRIVDSKHGKMAITHVKVIRRLPEQHQSWITCQLETGRTHQIRVHLSHIGHPLLGDPLYAASAKQTTSRLMLHATELAFCHPLTNEYICVEASPNLW